MTFRFPLKKGHLNNKMIKDLEEFMVLFPKF